ncbi:MAG TPA: hypothetical protein DDW19_04020 [Anaerolineaceae bacterium]|nr:hypothetical protein [Anaerolineaceae bacterium]
MSFTTTSKSHQEVRKQDANGKGFLIFAFMMMIALTFTVIQPIIPNDFFPYLRIGQEILSLGHLPATEFMTYTSYGNPALYLYWLPSLILLGIYNLGGVALTSIFTMACIGLFFLLLWKCLEELEIANLTAGLVLVLISLIAASYFPTRPQVLAFPLYGLSLWLILRWQRGKNRFLWLFPIIAFLWANIHGSFIVLFFMLLPAAIFGTGDRKRLVFVTVISFLATFLNAYTYHIWANMFSVVGNQSNQLFGSEWKPLTNKGWQSNVFFSLLLLVPVLTAFSSSRIKWIFWVWFLGFGWMSLSSVRYVIWFLPILAFILVQLLDPFIRKLSDHHNRLNNRTVNLLLGILLLIFPILLIPGIRNMWWQKASPNYNESTPVKAVEWLKSNPQLPGNLWSDFSFSTYMAYALPERKLFTTNRIEDFSTEQIEDYFRISSAEFDWESVLQKYEINLVIPSIQEQPALIRALSMSENWKQVYQDDRAMIFTRTEP